MSKFTEKDIQNICTRVAVSAWEKLTELEATFGEKYLEKFETVRNFERDITERGKRVSYPLPRYFKNTDDPHCSSVARLPSKILHIESLGLKIDLFQDFTDLCEEIASYSSPLRVDIWSGRFGSSDHLFFPLYNFAEFEYHEGFKKTMYEASIEQYEKDRNFEAKKKYERRCLFMKAMSTFGLLALGFTPNAIIPADTGDLMLLPNWREYRESVRKQEEENKRLQEKKEEEKKYQAILSELERLRKLEADVSKIVAADPPKKSPGSTKKYLKKDLVELAVTRGIKKTDARKMKKKDLLVILEIKDCDDSTEEQEGEEGEI